jgi:ubiquinol-cytochrome c reductase cytochrome b subunit
MIFVVIYFHIAKALFFRSYANPRIFLWISGVILFLLMILTAFIGYVLP